MELRSYQDEGVEFITAHRRVLLADEMGLGKSAQSLCAILTLRAEHSLVLCPGYARRTWRKEIIKWRPEASFVIAQGIEDAWDILTDPTCDISVVNYEVLPLVLNRLTKSYMVDGTPQKQAEAKARGRMKQIEFDAIIADEAHFLKNKNSSRSVVARGLKADVRIAMTGTPITSYIPEMWHLLHFIDPKRFSSYWRFVGEYCDVSQDYFGHYQIEDNREDKEAVIADFPDVVIRRLKKDHLKELPPVLFEPVYIELSAAERKAYNNMRDMGLAVIEGQLLKANVVIDQLQKLQRLAIGRGMYDDSIEESSKVSALVEICRERVEHGESVVVFSKWTRSIELARRGLEKTKILHHVVTGERSDREEVLDRFIDGDASVLCATIGAAGASLNLQRGNIVVFIDKSWVPAENEQAYSRVHRMGQTEPVTVVSLIAEETVDEYIEIVLERKASNIESALGDSWSHVAELAFQEATEEGQ